ncbi:MAG: phenylalanine--tRNA ligase subunit beta [Verrucomicrobiota bacterium]|nr:phenylalanine--tRNA ligase subunit beta [Verrucomicrobiota bacterium]
MKVSLNWLREFIQLPPDVAELVDLLTLAGVEVERIEALGCAVDNVIVAQILESVQHPNADRLSVCKVDDGSGAPRQIVCGATNYKAGDKVPLALPGAVLPGDFKIKVGKLRGVESQGMLCSPKELNLADDAEGLLILPPDARISAPITELFARDTVLDLEITPNRPDLLSHRGIAREIAALQGKRLSFETVALPSESTIQVATAACPLYTARRIRGVKVGPSPDWLRQRLEAVGLRPINNVVDITNYVMLDLGQPLHAFDAAKLEGAINVRQAREGEEFLALDGKTYKLSATHVVIADAARTVAIAGVMGGEGTGVTGATTDLLLESAVFQPQSVRRTSRVLGLSSESSYRFERGVDLDGVAAASQRATELILECAGGAAEAMQLGRSSDPEALRDGPEARLISLRPERVKRLLGVEVQPPQIDEILTGFGLTRTADGWQAPSFRPDLTREVDLIEEIARVVGMERIPARVQARFAPASETDRAYDSETVLRRALVAQGVHEARSLTLVPEQPLGLAYVQISPESLQRVKNAMIDDQVVLRPHLLHGLFAALRDNLRAGAKSVRLFEIGRVYSTRQPEEFTHAALVLSGSRAERTWRTPEVAMIDLFDLKGVLAAAFGSRVDFAPEENPALALSLRLLVSGEPAGFLGQLWPSDARALDATAPVVFAEVDLGLVAKARPGDTAAKYREIPRFPAVTRDIALLAPLELTHAQIDAAVRAAHEPLLARVELFDLFSDAAGASVPADKKSLAYSLTYRSADRTLTADEVNAAHARIKERLKSQLPVTLRE